MSEIMNSEKLKDHTILPNKKMKTTIYVRKETYSKIDSLIQLSGGNQSRNDIIEKAVDFYFAYVTGQMSQDYLCGVFGGKMEGLIGTLATRFSKSSFRSAVELDMLTRMVASVLQISKSDYDKLRVKAIRDVKQTNGSIDILEAISESEENILT